MEPRSGANLREPRRAATVFVAAGFVGASVAVARFLVAGTTTGDLWSSTRSFWQGNGYLLLAATAAIPGLGLLLLDAVRRGSRVRTAAIAAVMAAYVLLLAPSGQRGFALQIGLVIVAVLATARRLRLRVLAPAAVVVLALLGMTQAARNEARETGSITVAGVVARLEPGRLETLYGSQLSSFQWTWDVVAFGDQLDIPNTFLHAVAKPIPRQLMPDKVQGFGEEFTKRLYPDAFEQQVAFSVPLVAETYYVFGWLGVLLIFASLGAAVALLELYVVRPAPSSLRAILAVGLGWSAFILLRGDLANALVFSSAWIVPLVAVSAYVGYLPSRRGRLVVDALQVPAEFSGVGRMVQSIGEDLAKLDRPVEVRCAADVVELLRPAFAPSTQFRIPIASSRPRLIRLIYQQVVAPVLDRRSTLLVCPGDQAPLWGRARVLLVVYDVRRLTKANEEKRLETLFYRLIVPRGARRASGLITASEFSGRELRRAIEGRLPQIRVVGHRTQTRPASHQAAGTGTLLVVGAMRPYKGVETVIDALALVEGPVRPTLTLVGSTEGRSEELERYALVRGVRKSLTIRGWLDEDTLEQLYGRALATVNPSTYEGYGLPVAESLAHGVPTIASDIPPHREIADGAALFFEPRNALALAGLIRLVVRDENLRAKLSLAAWNRSQVIGRSGPTWGELVADVAEAFA